MSKPDPKKNPANFDVRVVQRNVAQGTLTAADQKAFMEALPDVSDKAEPLHVSQPGSLAEEDDDEGND